MTEYRSIELNVKIGCPIGCLYCPQDKFVKANIDTKRLLSQENLEAIINNLTFGKQLAKVFFAGMSEPFSHEKCVDFIEYCSNHKYITNVIVFTTGYRLTDEKIQRLSKIKKLKMNFHVGEKEKMPNFDDKILNKIDQIKKSIKNCDFINVGFEKNSKLENHLQKIGVNLKFQPIISRSGNLEAVGDQTIDKKFTNCAVTCPRVSNVKRPVILPDGTALACANDYSCELTIGNLITSVWDDLDFDRIARLQKIPCDLPCFRDCHLATKSRPEFKML